MVGKPCRRSALLLLCLSICGCDLLGLEGIADRLDARLREFIQEVRNAVNHSTQWQALVASIQADVNNLPAKAAGEFGIEIRATFDFILDRILGDRDTMEDVVAITALLKEANKRWKSGDKQGADSKYNEAAERAGEAIIRLKRPSGRPPVIVNFFPKSFHHVYEPISKTWKKHGSDQVVILTGYDLIQSGPANRYKVSILDKKGEGIEDVSAHLRASTPYFCQLNISDSGIRPNRERGDDSILVEWGDRKLAQLFITYGPVTTNNFGYVDIIIRTTNENKEARAGVEFEVLRQASGGGWVTAGTLGATGKRTITVPETLWELNLARRAGPKVDLGDRRPWPQFKSNPGGPFNRIPFERDLIVTLYTGADQNWAEETDHFARVQLSPALPAGAATPLKLRVKLYGESVDWNASFRVRTVTGAGQTIESPMGGAKVFQTRKGTAILDVLEWTW